MSEYALRWPGSCAIACSSDCRQRPVDEVEAHLESGILRPLHDERNPLGVVRALERCEDVRYSGLHAEGDPGESGSLERSQVVRVDGVGVRLGRDLGIRSKPPGVAHGGGHCH